ncbi:MAG: DNA/RNA non-specific endonuclease, partial [Campylobacter sp.]|nr:DNA/RNA non-specific endonuclease [Campylobacter sp.]
MIKNIFKIIIISLFFTQSFSAELVLDNKFYKVIYDTKLNSALKVSYILDEKVNKKNISKRPTFKKDERLLNGIKPSDYLHSGFDKGHLASDASFDWSEESLESVYLMSNI